jgi:hypothetical protein
MPIMLKFSSKVCIEIDCSRAAGVASRCVNDTANGRKSWMRGMGSRFKSHSVMGDNACSLSSSLRKENDDCPGLFLYFKAGCDVGAQLKRTIERL